MLNITSS